MPDDQNLNIRITTTADTAGAKQTEAALAGVNQAAGKTAAGAAHAGVEIKHAGQEVKELGRLGHEAEGVLLGLERGGISGLASAAKNLGGIIRALASGTIGAVLIPVMAVATTGFYILKHAAEENGKAIDKIYKDLEQATKAYDTRLKQLTKTLNEEYDAQKRAISALKEFYSELSNNDADSEKRFQTITKATREQQDAELELAKTKALAAAQTPEAKAKVEKDFELQKKNNEEVRKGADLKHQSIEADTAAARATGKKTEAERQKAEDEKKLNDLKTERDSAIAVRGSLLGHPESAEFKAADVEAKARDEAYKQNHLKFEDSIKELTAVITQADREIKDTTLTKDETTIKRKTLRAEEQKRLVELSGPSDAEGKYHSAEQHTADIEQAIKDEDNRATMSHKFGDMGNTAALKTELAASRKVTAEAFTTFIEDSKARSKEMKNLNQSLKNTREGGS